MAVSDTAIDPSKAHDAANQRIDDIINEVLDFEDISGRTSLHAALEQGQLECASILLEEDDVDATVKNSASNMLPVHVFLSRDGILSNQSLLSRLLQDDERQAKGDAQEAMTEGCIINAQSIEKVTPLMIAAANAHLGSARQVDSSFAFENEACQDILGAEGDILSSGPKSRRKHNHARKDKEKEQRIHAVVEESGQVGEVIGDEASATEQVSRKKSLDFVVENLVTKKADASLQDIHGCTALDYAARAGILSHVEFLCQQAIITRLHVERALFTTMSSSGPHASNINVVKYLMLYAGSLSHEASALRAQGMGPEFSGESALFGTPHPILGETILHVAARFGRSR